MIDSINLPLAALEDTAVEAARAGGAVLMERLDRERVVQFKGEIDLVTDADRDSETAVVGVLRSRFPDHGVLAEEGSAGGSSSIYRWIVDPLDGTTNYAHGYPHFAVSVAAERRGRVVAGAVFDPVLGELFVARRGGGATLNGRRIGVSGTDDLGRALISIGFPYDRKLFNATLRRWERFSRVCQAVRRDGVASLDICYVAAGRFDGFCEDHLHPWDSAAAALVLQEAGGTVTDYHGKELDIFQGEVCASNGILHRKLLRGLADAVL